VDDLLRAERPRVELDRAFRVLDGNVVGERYSSTPFREVFAYDAEWPLVSAARRREIEGLIGAPAPLQPPGPEAGEQAGFPGAGDPTRGHQDLRGAGGAASEAG